MAASHHNLAQPAEQQPPPQQRQGPPQPKLRSSCDACGAAKLRCDREDPKCSRCSSRGIACIYGISRKRGRVPNDQSQAANERRRVDSAKSQTTSVVGKDAIRGSDDNKHINNNVEVDIATDPFASQDVAFDWGMHEGDVLMDNHGGEEAGLQNNAFDLLMTGFPAVHFDEQMFLDLTPREGVRSTAMPLQDTSLDHSMLRSASLSKQVMQPPYMDSYCFDRPVEPIPCSKTCYETAYRVLGKLSLPEDLRKDNMSAIVSSSSRSGSMSAASLGTHRSIPMDDVFCISRESMQQISALIACPGCSQRPQDALLHASVLWRILLWYQSVMTGRDRVESSPILTASDDGSSTMSSAPSPTSWTNNSHGYSTFSRHSSHSSPSRSMSIHRSLDVHMGRFRIDDQDVQKAVEHQLLIGELRRLGTLIEDFAGQNPAATAPVEGDLRHVLGAWLTKEHAHAIDTVKRRLEARV